MLINFFKKILFNRNNKIFTEIENIVDLINSMENNFKLLSDKELQEKTKEFKHRIKYENFSLSELLPESYATVREASRRIFGMRHFDVQLMGGIVLNKNCIAEMKTGEGKTLTSTLPIYLNALQEKGVHVVTMNDYLAERDANKNKLLFEFLGLSVGINLPNLSNELKKKAYKCDITYGTNHEYGFDYLRDNMVYSKEERVQRKLFYALIDEVDSILIDESRTPLIISGPIEEDLEIYSKINKLVSVLLKQKKEDSEKFLGSGDYFVDEKFRQIHLTERGLTRIEKLLLEEKIINKNEILYSEKNIILIQYILSALKANELFIKNIDYVVNNNKIIIIDEHTGRMMHGRRWSEGLHQAIEAKENVEIKCENQTLASITFQNYFRLYEKLSGMTGTASTESFEFNSIYNLKTITIPTNRPMIRKDLPDLIYATEEEKINAIIEDIKRCVKKKQPVLVGTVSIEKSEFISKKLKKLKIQHNVLNAKFHSTEAEIIAKAGILGAVTIATNMAGRGTDIVLGGNLNCFSSKKKSNSNFNKNIIKKWNKNHKRVLLSGGLHIIGTERHESRRIDNQLRGRSGRQGDIGSSRFYLSMQDSLIRIFSSEKLIFFMRKLGMKKGDPIEHRWVSKAVKQAQRKVENINFLYRKQLLEYDDVMNSQRKIIYNYRKEIIDLPKIRNIIIKIIKDVLLEVISFYYYSSSKKEILKFNKLILHLKNDFILESSIFNWINCNKKLEKNSFSSILIDLCINYYLNLIKLNFFKIFKKYEKFVVLSILDSFWKEHLFAMDSLRQGIQLRSYAQKDPKQEYKRESFFLFCSMIHELKYEIVSFLFQNKDSSLNFNIGKSCGNFFKRINNRNYSNFYSILRKKFF
ncbi:Protein translocase subunit SecA [Buchnera aphidicola (Tetraneura ulmi)]|uniref:preprotein translocase subunit SecA n=1 Tax=Buchnera aphidicola TaxID=9 RepID=UPI003464537F